MSRDVGEQRSRKRGFGTYGKFTVWQGPLTLKGSGQSASRTYTILTWQDLIPSSLSGPSSLSSPVPVEHRSRFPVDPSPSDTTTVRTYGGLSPISSPRLLGSRRLWLRILQFRLPPSVLAVPRSPDSHGSVSSGAYSYSGSRLWRDFGPYRPGLISGNDNLGSRVVARYSERTGTGVIRRRTRGSFVLGDWVRRIVTNDRYLFPRQPPDVHPSPV